MNIALVAHDGRKKEMMEWVKYNYKILSKHNLYATGTTGKLIENIKVEKPERKEYLEFLKTADEYALKHYTGVEYPREECYDSPLKGKVVCLLSGPLGGDMQIGAMAAEGKLDFIVFFCDNLTMQGHQFDVLGLNRIINEYNIPFATNRSTADMIITSPLFDNSEYHRIIPKCLEDYKNRQL